MIENPTNYGTPERVEKLRQVLRKRQRSITAVFENIADPHNVSACLRSCEAVGMMEVCFVNNTQPFPSLGEKSSASARKWLDRKQFKKVSDCYSYLRQQGKLIYTTHLSAQSTSIYDADLTKNVALVFGNEHSGVSEEALDLSDGNILIPQIGIIQSLNISVACAVSVFEAFRQRLAAGTFERSELSEEEININLIEWLRR